MDPESTRPRYWAQMGSAGYVEILNTGEEVGVSRSARKYLKKTWGSYKLTPFVGADGQKWVSLKIGGKQVSEFLVEQVRRNASLNFRLSAEDLEALARPVFRLPEKLGGGLVEVPESGGSTCFLEFINRRIKSAQPGMELISFEVAEKNVKLVYGVPSSIFQGLLATTQERFVETMPIINSIEVTTWSDTDR